MSLTLTVDGDRWRSHLLATVAKHPGIVPVTKGNGYGLTVGRLARRAQWLAEHAGETGARLDLLAVGTYDEIDQAATRYDGDLLVLTPWRPFGAALELDERTASRVVHTVSRPDDLAALRERDPGARFVLEQLTSMLRHGMTRRDLATAAEALRETGTGRGGLRGVAMHLPLNTTSHLSEVSRLINDIVASGLPTRTVFVSHLTHGELARLATSYPDFTVRPRVGTALWLGDRGALAVTATVLDVHDVERGEVFGYRGRSVPKASASRRRPATSRSRHGPPPWPGAGSTRSASSAHRSPSTASSGSSPSRLTCRRRCCSCPQELACPASARRSRSGSASPRPTSTASSSADAWRSTAATNQPRPTTRSRMASQ
jgi:hypothetical protein